MGVSATTSAKPRAPSATGEYAKTDPFEIAKEKYKKKPAIEDLQARPHAKIPPQALLCMQCPVQSQAGSPCELTAGKLLTTQKDLSAKLDKKKPTGFDAQARAHSTHALS